MRKPEQDSSESRQAPRIRYTSLASMSVLAFAFPRVLPEGTGLTPTPAPAATPSGAELQVPTIPSPSPTRAPRVYLLALDTQGRVAQDVLLASDDGMAVLSLSAKTIVTDAQGLPLRSITITTKKLQFRTDAAYVGSAYEFGPRGAKVDPPAPLTIRYSTRAYYPFRVDAADTGLVYLAYLGKNGPVRPALASAIRETASVSAPIGLLETLVLYCEFTKPPYP